VYDAYGNPITIAASTGDGYSKTTTNTYAVNTANWFLGRLPDQGSNLDPRINSRPSTLHPSRMCQCRSSSHPAPLIIWK